MTLKKFVYLGATVTAPGGAGEDISVRLGKAKTVFYNLKNIWKNSQLSINTKLKHGCPSLWLQNLANDLKRRDQA